MRSGCGLCAGGGRHSPYPQPRRRLHGPVALPLWISAGPLPPPLRRQQAAAPPSLQHSAPVGIGCRRNVSEQPLSDAASSQERQVNWYGLAFTSAADDETAERIDASSDATASLSRTACSQPESWTENHLAVAVADTPLAESKIWTRLL